MTSKLVTMGRVILDVLGHEDWRVATLHDGNLLGCASHATNTILLSTRLYKCAPLDTIFTILHEVAHLRSGHVDHNEWFNHQLTMLMDIPVLVKIYTALDEHLADIQSSAMI